MKISTALLAVAVAFGLVTSAFANDREEFSVGRLQIETDITATDGSLTISNATLASATLTDPAINGRAAVLSSSATAELVVETLSAATNAQIWVFTTPFSAAPEVFVQAETWNATNLTFGATLVTPTNASVFGASLGGLRAVAIGPK